MIFETKLVYINHIYFVIFPMKSKPLERISITTLQDDTECRIDDWYYTQYIVGEIKEEIKFSKENKLDWEDRIIYICDEIDMPKYNISHIIDSIWEHMDEEHEDWCEKNWDSLDSLYEGINNVFNNWWNTVPHTVRWRNRQVILDDLYIEIL